MAVFRALAPGQKVAATFTAGSTAVRGIVQFILSMGADVGVRLGDRVTIFGGNGNVTVASAEIVRVDRRSATALVVSQTLGSVSTGLRVRVTEKLP